MNYKLPEFATKSELFKYLVANKSLLVKQKKSAIKRCDSFTYVVPNVEAKEFITKDIAVNSDAAPTGTLTIKVVGNTTNLMDCHDDVHIQGLWKKTLAENKSFLHLQEHDMEFDSVISDDMQCYTKTIAWSKLGFNYEGSTQALIGESVADVTRNEFMCNQYRKGWVKNHSVGMQYVNIVLCINSEAEYDKEYKANWDKYYPQIANKDVADDHGYFWAVLEAKLIEISAVVRGSNYVTPTQSVEENKEADIITSQKIEPSEDTHKAEQANIISKLKFI